MSKRNSYYEGADDMKTAAIKAVQEIYNEYLKNHEILMNGVNEPADTQSHKYLHKIIIAIGNLKSPNGEENEHPK